MKYSCVHRYQQQKYRSPFNTGLNATLGVIVIRSGTLNGIEYYSRINLVSVCAGMTAVDRYGMTDK